MDCMKKFEVFEDLGPAHGQKIPDGYTLIRAHFVRAVKHDGRHRRRIVAGGHLTEDPTESVYSGVVSLRGLRMVLFLAELNGYTPYAADVSSAYLTAKTNEKVCIIAGSEFLDAEGTAIYQSMIGALQWCVSIGRLDITVSVMSMSGFRSAPR